MTTQCNNLDSTKNNNNKNIDTVTDNIASNIYVLLLLSAILWNSKKNVKHQMLHVYTSAISVKLHYFKNIFKRPIVF